MLKSIVMFGAAISAIIAISPAAHAQLSIRSTQNVARVLVGNGSTQNGSVASVPTTRQPLIGVGALSPGHHSGSLATVSLLNTGRLLGVDVGGGRGAKTSVSVANPGGKPILVP